MTKRLRCALCGRRFKLPMHLARHRSQHRAPRKDLARAERRPRPAGTERLQQAVAVLKLANQALGA